MTNDLRIRLEHAGVDHRLSDLFARNMESTEGKDDTELKMLIIRGDGVRWTPIARQPEPCFKV
jgi:hypothetical protein